MSEENKDHKNGGMSRRKFLKGFGLTVAGAALGGGVVGSLNKGEKTEPTKEIHNEAPTEFNKALMHFTPEQFRIVEAATERIFPKDENGPGAKELLVAYYIDHQLAGTWGVNGKEYRQGPFYAPEPTQGHHVLLNRQQIFQNGTEALEKYSQNTYENRFSSLSDEEQDEVLTTLSEGKIEVKGVSSSYFFHLLRSATLEGVYADPLYGGNKDMDGWKMKSFPGHQMSFVNIIDQDFKEVEPAALSSQHKHG